MSTPSSTHTALLATSRPPPESLFSTLLTASHILHHNSIVDAYGHISVRSPQNPSGTFFLSRSLAPALVSTRQDIQEYRIEDASPVNSSEPQAVKHFAERCIHSEIYKLYPEVKAVVHCHSEAVIPFGIGSVPLRPVFHMAGTMGAQVPVFDIAQHYPSSSSSPLHSLLVTNTHLGAALAAGFNPTPSVLSKGVTALKNYLTSSTPSAVPFPPCPTVLMRGHGMTCVGRSIEEVVYRAIFTCVNARVQTTALLMQGGYNLGYVAQRFGEGGGKEGGNPGPARQEGVKFLSERECRDSWTEMEDKTGRAWELWCKEVEEVGLYRNEVRDGLRSEASQ